METLQSDLTALVKARRLKEIAGIGSALAAIIEEIYRTGECWLLQQHSRGELPPGAVELSAVPGLSLKKIVALHDALHIESIADLKAACQEGLGQQSQRLWREIPDQAARRIVKNSKYAERRILLLYTMLLKRAETMLNYLRACPQLIEAGLPERCGGARRPSGGLPSSPRPISQARCSIGFLRYPALARPMKSRMAALARLAGGERAELVVVAPQD